MDIGVQGDSTAWMGWEAGHIGGWGGGMCWSNAGVMLEQRQQLLWIFHTVDSCCCAACVMLINTMIKK